MLFKIMTKEGLKVEFLFMDFQQIKLRCLMGFLHKTILTTEAKIIAILMGFPESTLPSLFNDLR
jgi:hypothetical protein